jgi:hypothetical protein
MTLLFARSAFLVPLAPKEFPHPFLVLGIALYGSPSSSTTSHR